MQIDTSTDFGHRVSRRLVDEIVIWLTTTGSDGTPQPRPVWYLWDGETFLIYSMPDTHKIAHIRANPRVSLNFDSDGRGGDIAVFTGTASLEEGVNPAEHSPDYIHKYHSDIRGIDMTVESFSRDYNVAIRVTPDRLRGE